MKTIKVLLVIFCVLVPIRLLHSSDMVSEIESVYREITDIKGTFKQKSHLRDLDRTETYEGEFFIKIPSKFRWSYRGKAPQEVIVSGNTIIIYQKKENQALKGRFDPSRYGQAPIALLGGFGNLREVFDVREKDNSIILKPKEPMGNIKSIELFYERKGFPIRSFRITDTALNTIEVTLKDVELNTGLSEKVFQFIPPQGVEIIEGF